MILNEGFLYNYASDHQETLDYKIFLKNSLILLFLLKGNMHRDIGMNNVLCDHNRKNVLLLVIL